MSQTKKNNSISNPKVKSRKVKEFQSGGTGEWFSFSSRQPKEPKEPSKPPAPKKPKKSPPDDKDGHHSRIGVGVEDVDLKVNSEDPGHSMQCVEDYHFLGFRNYKSIDDIIIEQVLEFLNIFDKIKINHKNFDEIIDIIKNINIIILEVFKNYTLYVVKSNAYNLIIEKKEIFDKFTAIETILHDDKTNNKFSRMFYDKSKIIKLIKLYKDHTTILFNTINQFWNGAKWSFISTKDISTKDSFNNFDEFNELIGQINQIKENNDFNELIELKRKMDDYKNRTESEFKIYDDDPVTDNQSIILRVIDTLVEKIKKFYNEIQDFTHEDLKNTNCENTNDITYAYANKKIEELVNSYTTDSFKFDQIENLKTNIEIHEKIKEHLSEIKRSSEAMMNADNGLIAVVEKINNEIDKSNPNPFSQKSQITSWSGDGVSDDQKQQLNDMRTKVINSINSLLKKLRETKGEINGKKTNIINEMKARKDLNDKKKKFIKEDVEQIVTNISKFQIYNILLKSLNSVEISLTEFVNGDRNPGPSGESKAAPGRVAAPEKSPFEVQRDFLEAEMAKTSKEGSVELPEQADTLQVEEPSGESE